MDAERKKVADSHACSFCSFGVLGFCVDHRTGVVCAVCDSCGGVFDVDLELAVEFVTVLSDLADGRPMESEKWRPGKMRTKSKTRIRNESCCGNCVNYNLHSHWCRKQIETKSAAAWCEKYSPWRRKLSVGSGVV